MPTDPKPVEGFAGMPEHRQPTGGKPPPEPVEGYWWCSECRQECPWHQVTYEEFHEPCGTRVSWKKNILRDSKSGEGNRPEQVHVGTTTHISCGNCNATLWQPGQDWQPCVHFFAEPCSAKPPQDDSVREGLAKAMQRIVEERPCGRTWEMLGDWDRGEVLKMSTAALSFLASRGETREAGFRAGIEAAAKAVEAKWPYSRSPAGDEETTRYNLVRDLRCAIRALRMEGGKK